MAGRGTIGKRDGSWYFKIDLPPDPITGKRRPLYRRGFRTKTEAQAALDVIRSEIRAGDYTRSNTWTMDEWVDQCLTSIKLTCADGTYRTYEQNWRLHLSPKLGHLRVGKVTTLHVQRALEDCLAEGYAPNTVASYERALGNFFRQAINADLITKSPLRSVKRANAVVTRDAVWTPEEASDFLMHARDRYAIFPLASVALATGMRVGELRALRCSDFDLEARFVHVERQLDVHSDRPRAPKYDSRRKIALPESVLPTIEAQLARSNRTRDALIFGHPDGRPKDYNSYRESLKRAIKSWGGKPLTIHGLRHTYATIALSAGVNPRALAYILGHKDPAITLRVYGHVMSDDVNGAAARVDDVLSFT